MTSCHHGDVHCQNNLARALRVIDANREIKVVEIDFVQIGHDFISSHDYKPENVSNGSSLREWVHALVIQRKKILWIDIKSHVDIIAFTLCDVRVKFDCAPLFNALARLCRETKRRLQDNVWLSCQDSEVRHALIRHNNTRIKERNRWLIATDIPYVPSYACKAYFPHAVFSWFNEYVFGNTFMTLDYTETRALIVCIDHTFFWSDASLISFIEESSIPAGSTIVLYTYERPREVPIEVLGYTIIMQYDYTHLQREEEEEEESVFI
jgi:hypothetical protein